jgi:hypothetical protein
VGMHTERILRWAFFGFVAFVAAAGSLDLIA